MKGKNRQIQTNDGDDGLCIEYEEAFISPDKYPEMLGLDGVPDLSLYPDGFYLLGTKGFASIIGVYKESQIDKMSGRGH